jgi:hypothetical protein
MTRITASFNHIQVDAIVPAVAATSQDDHGRVALALGVAECAMQALELLCACCTIVEGEVQDTNWAPLLIPDVPAEARTR